MNKIYVICLLFAVILGADFDAKAQTFSPTKGQFTFGKTQRKAETVSITWQNKQSLNVESATHEVVCTQAAPIFSAEITATTALTWQANEWEIPFAFTGSETVFLNGFQSWTACKEQSVMDKTPRLAFPVVKALQHYGDYTFAHTTHKKGRLHGWTYGYIRLENGEILLIGALDEANGFTQISLDVQQQVIRIRKEWEGVIKPQGKYSLMKLFVQKGEESAVFQAYFAALGLQKKGAQTTGWTSWYNYYTNINEAIIQENLHHFTEANVPMDYFQIDDGWQMAVGDWLKVNEKFPNGMASIASHIQASGFKAGLWLAPYICEQKSEIVQQHPDWILKDEKGKWVQAGLNPGWSGKFYALNPAHPEVKAYLRKVFDTVLNEWGFDMVKLDFLYAASIIPQGGKSRGEVAAEAMDFLREVCGEKKILGCGVPIGTAMGRVDYCRIGADVGLTWQNKLLDWAHYAEAISTEKTLYNTMFRHQLNTYAFVNDPDVYILRPDNHKLTPQQQQTLFVINQIFGGLNFTSDNISKYSIAATQAYFSQFPFQPKVIHSIQPLSMLSPNKKSLPCYQAHFMIGDKTYIAIMNMSKSAIQLRFPDTDYIWIQPASATPVLYQNTDTLSLLPYETRIFIKYKDAPLQLLTEEKQLFPLQALTLSTTHPKELSLSTAPRGKVWIQVPEEGKYTVNGKMFLTEMWNGKWVIEVK